MLTREERERNQTHAKTLERIARGLANHWYPILQAKDLAAAPLALRRFGEDLVLWRDATGRPHVFENHCPHRRAPLSLGRVRDGELVCAYHGWRFNSAGECIDMPLEATPRSHRAPVCVRSYPVEDRAGYIWMFYGAGEAMTPLAVPEELEDPERQTFNTDYVWQTNWMNVLDNVLDPLHAIHLHAGAVTQRKRAKFKNFEITHEDERGFRLGKVGYREDGSVGSVEGEVEFLLPNVLRLTIADGTEEGIYRVVIIPTPIDETSVCAFYARSRRGRGLKRLRWRLWWAMHGHDIHRVAGEDRDIMAGLGPVGKARLKEHLVVSDTGVVRLRKRLHQAYLRNEASPDPLDASP